MLDKILKLFLGNNKSSNNEDEAVITRIEETFNHICETFPNRNLHFYLTETYLQVLLGSGMINNVNDPDIQVSASTKTYILSFVPKENVGRILGIFMLSEFDPTSYQKNHKLKKEFDEIMIPLQSKYNA